MPHLRVVDLPGRGTFDLKIDKSGLLGRDESCAYHVEHPTISRQHAELHIGAAAIVVVDQNSANGTSVNGKRIDKPTALSHGDTILFGSINAKFFISQGSALPATLETTNKPKQVPSSPNKTDLLQVSAPSSGTIGLDQLEHTLTGILNVLTQPSAMTQRAEHIGGIFMELLPSLKQAALLDPCGKLVGGIPGGRFFEPPFYEAIAGAVASHNGSLELYGPALSGMEKTLGLSAVPEVVVCLPLNSSSFRNGALYLESDRRFYSGDIADTLRLAAKLLGPLLDRAPEDACFELTVSDLRLAQRIQRRLLPALDVPGYRIASVYVPHYAVGGDFIDSRITKKGEIAFVLGDVSGKGVSGSLVMAQINTACRFLLPNAISPSGFLSEMNVFLSSILEPGVFSTMAVMFLSPDKGQARVALAGHHPPVLRTKGGRVIELGFEPGPALGTVEKLEVKEQRVLVASGDCIVLTSDGVEEAENAKQDMFGAERRTQTLERISGAGNLAIGLREAVFSFCGEERSSDDLTILVIERND